MVVDAVGHENAHRHSRNVIDMDWGLVKLALPAKVTRRANKVIEFMTDLTNVPTVQS
jgi:hypothetical protein